MESLDVDWKMEEEECCKSDVNWMLEKGLSLGMKVVVTGIVISAAPVILPSVVIVSALGFAVSIPFGIAFASFACTQNLMNKLLPMPTSSSVLGRETMVAHQDGKEEEVEDRGAKGSGAQGVDVEEEGQGQTEIFAEGEVKMIDFVENESKLTLASEGDDDEDGDVNDARRDQEERMSEENESVKNRGYKEDVGKSSPDQDEKRPRDVMDVKIEGEEEEAEKGPIKEEIKDDPLHEQEEKSTASDAAKKTKKKKKKNKSGEEKSQFVERKDDNTSVGTVQGSENPVENENDNEKTLDQEKNKNEPEMSPKGASSDQVQIGKSF